MDKYTATELAFKHGYEKGYEAGKRDAVKWVSSSEQKPTEKDADKYGRVLVIEHGYISCAHWLAPFNFPDIFTYWLPMPKQPKEGI